MSISNSDQRITAPERTEDTKLNVAHYCVWVSGIIVVVILFLQRVRWLVQQPYPYDYDGFYYLQEFRSRLIFGEAYFHRFSPVFWFLTAVGKLFRMGPMQLFNSTVAVSQAVFLISLLIILSSSPRRYLHVAVAILAARSDALFFLFYGYLKQGVAFAIVFLAIAIITVTKNRVARLFAFSSLTLGMVFHLFATTIVAEFFLAVIWSRVKRRIVIVIASVGAVSVLALMALFFGKHFEQEISWEGVAPWLHATSWISHFESHEYLLYTASAVFILLSAGSTKPSKLPYTLFLLTTLALELPIWSRGGGSWFRFLLSSSLVWFLAISLFLKRDSDSGEASRTTSNVVLAGVLLLLLTAPPSFAESRRIGPGWSFALLRDNAATLKSRLPKNTFIVAVPGIQYPLTYFLDVPAAHHSPAVGDYKIFYAWEAEHKLSCDESSSTQTTLLPDGSCFKIADNAKSSIYLSAMQALQDHETSRAQ